MEDDAGPEAVGRASRRRSSQRRSRRSIVAAALTSTAAISPALFSMMKSTSSRSR
jgi:hypothetical protein